jgi:hypothetical protein
VLREEKRKGEGRGGKRKRREERGREGRGGEGGLGEEERSGKPHPTLALPTMHIPHLTEDLNLP